MRILFRVVLFIGAILVVWSEHTAGTAADFVGVQEINPFGRLGGRTAGTAAKFVDGFRSALDPVFATSLPSVFGLALWATMQKKRAGSQALVALLASTIGGYLLQPGVLSPQLVADVINPGQHSRWLLDAPFGLAGVALGVLIARNAPFNLGSALPGIILFGWLSGYVVWTWTPGRHSVDGAPLPGSEFSGTLAAQWFVYCAGAELALYFNGKSSAPLIRAAGLAVAFSSLVWFSYALANVHWYKGMFYQ